jgi:hypothetical protein
VDRIELVPLQLPRPWKITLHGGGFVTIDIRLDGTYVCVGGICTLIQ